ncbi:MAG: hydroxymethylglutaryl-CoA lyase [Pseudomonadota bacterium]
MAKVEIVEVSPRDGIQNEKTLLSLEDKLALIRKAAAAGAGRIEVCSFVNPSRVPQMAGAEEVCAALPGIRAEGHAARFIGLVLNGRGLERAVAMAEDHPGGLDEAGLVVVTTDTFNQRNQGRPTFETVEQFAGMMAEARGSIGIGVTIGASFGCPFEGEVPLERLLEVVEAVMKHGPKEIALADTIGVATPKDVAERAAEVKARFPGVPLRLHLHNTRNTGIANAWAGVMAGASSLDSSFGGVGGCPFAPKATGNIATEDLLYLLERSGVETGMDLQASIDAAEWLEGKLGHGVPGMVMKAGGFPQPQAA